MAQFILGLLPGFMENRMGLVKVPFAHAKAGHKLSLVKFNDMGQRDPGLFTGVAFPAPVFHFNVKTGINHLIFPNRKDITYFCRHYLSVPFQILVPVEAKP